MGATLNWYWRSAVVTACFVAFAISGVGFTLVLFPLLCLLGTERRIACSQWLIHKFFSFIIAVLRAGGCMHLQTAGIERLKKAGAVLIVANHPTYIDVVVLLSLIPGANCVVKSDHWENPVFGGILRAAGWIRSSRADQLLDGCNAALAAGRPLIIFPEGTRTRRGEPMKFLQGAAYVAFKSTRPIVPVLLHCEPVFLSKGDPWYQATRRPFVFRVLVREPMRAEALTGAQRSPVVAARRLSSALESYFTKELALLAPATAKQPSAYDRAKELSTTL
jgi:1-acyl-sn-glycerol-3-phosphate acyltransferase